MDLFFRYVVTALKMSAIDQDFLGSYDGHVRPRSFLGNQQWVKVGMSYQLDLIQ